MSNQKNAFAAHLERKIDMGKCTTHFREIAKRVCPHTAGSSESVFRCVCSLPRHVHAPTRLH